MADHYFAFMLRLWQVENGDSAVWRISLENPHTGECCAFLNREALFAFLEALMQRRSPSEAEAGHAADLPGVESA